MLWVLLVFISTWPLYNWKRVIYLDSFLFHLAGWAVQLQAFPLPPRVSCRGHATHRHYQKGRTGSALVLWMESGPSQGEECLHDLCLYGGAKETMDQGNWWCPVSYPTLIHMYSTLINLPELIKFPLINYRNNIQPRESRLTEHVMVMQSFVRGDACGQCRRLLKGLFYQGYKCVRCSSAVHRECIPLLRRCGSIQAQPPQLPPRPLLLPIPSLSQDSVSGILVSFLILLIITK